MPDPIDELDNFSIPGPPMNPLPAAEVRRRGNRIRRRNNALATVGALAVVAAIAAPVAIAAGGSSDSIEPAGTVDWVTTVPDGLGLDEGLPDAEVQEDYARQAVEVCEGAGWAPDAGVAPVDVQQVIQTESEGGWDRTIALYPDEETAQETLASTRSRVQQCEDSTKIRPRSTEVVDSDEHRLVYVDHMSEAGDAYVNRVVQVGNALLVDTTYSGGTGDPQVVADTVALIDAKSSGLVSRMCVFSAEGCATEEPSEAAEEPTGLSGTIPDDFPLEKGLPTDQSGGAVGLEGPSHELDLEVYNVENTVQACGVAPSGLPEAVDTLSAGYRSPAEGILRQLMTFESAEDAQTYVDNLIAPFGGCPEDPEGGLTKVYEVTQPDLGDSTFVSTMRVEADGEPGIGYQVVAATRVGQAVLFTLVNNDTEPFDAEVAASYVEKTQTVVDEMG